MRWSSFLFLLFKFASYFWDSSISAFSASPSSVGMIISFNWQMFEPFKKLKYLLVYHSIVQKSGWKNRNCVRCQKPLGFRKHDPESSNWAFEDRKLCNSCFEYVKGGIKQFDANYVEDIRDSHLKWKVNSAFKCLMKEIGWFLTPKRKVSMS